MKTNLSFFAIAILWLNIITVQHLQAQDTEGNASYNLNRNPITGIRNSAFGYQALRSNTIGNFNTACGNSALYSNTTGYGNVASGANALFSNTSGIYNTASGSESLFLNTDGNGNTSSGTSSLQSNTTGSYNSAFGIGTLYKNTTANYNMASGSYALTSNTTGTANTASGYSSLYDNTAGNFNTALGYSSLLSNTTGTFNTASGSYALYSNTTGTTNTASGYSALYYNTYGYNNTALGNFADFSFNNTNSTFLGAQSDAYVAVENSTAVGFQAVVDDDNQVRIGNTAVTSIGGQVDWTTLSDGRFKKDLKENVPGISFINKLRPITYNLDVSAIDSELKARMPEPKEGESKLITQPQPSENQLKSKASKAQIKYTGFVAQEVEKAAQELGYDFSGVDAPKSKEGFYGLRYSEFVVPLVKAVQELSKQNEEQQKQIGELKELVAKLIKTQEVNSPTHSTTTVTRAYLEQNTPNPFGGLTTIVYHLPSTTSTGKVVITSISGQVLETFTVSGSQTGVLTLQAGSLASGTYIYSLWVDNHAVDTKQMIVH